MQHANLFMTHIVVVSFPPRQGFDTFRADETLCDVVLVPGDSEQNFLVHRVIMASSSDYFKAMFTGESSCFIRLKADDIGKLTLRLVMQPKRTAALYVIVRSYFHGFEYCRFVMSLCI